MRWVLALAVTTGCGAPFSAQLFSDSGDAASEAAVMPRDAGAEAFAAEAALEAGAVDRSEDAAVVDSWTAAETGAGDVAVAEAEAGVEDAAPEACAPHPIDAGMCFGALYQSTEFPVWAGGVPESGCGGSTSYPTPTACFCDYSCSCLTANASAACAPNGGVASCSETNGVPIVACVN